MRKEIIIFSTAIMLSIPAAMNITGIKKAEAAQMQNVLELSASDEGIVPYADVIVKKFRVINGVMQYRRWNETKGYWVDSDWITL